MSAVLGPRSAEDHRSHSTVNSEKTANAPKDRELRLIGLTAYKMPTIKIRKVKDELASDGFVATVGR
jgi:hypothetical protein